MIYEKEKLPILDIAQGTYDVIFNIWLIFTIVCLILLVIIYFFWRRNYRVGAFLKDFNYALYAAIISDILSGKEPKYSYNTLKETMWSYDKILYSFWVRKREGAFYDPGLYDYVKDYMSIKSKI